MGVFDIIILPEPIKFEYFTDVISLQTKYRSLYRDEKLYLEAHELLKLKENYDDLNEIINHGWLELYFEVTKVKSLEIVPYLHHYKPETINNELVYDSDFITFRAKPSLFKMSVSFIDRFGKNKTVQTSKPLPFDKIYLTEKEMINTIKKNI